MSSTVMICWLETTYVHIDRYHLLRWKQRRPVYATVLMRVWGKVLYTDNFASCRLLSGSRKINYNSCYERLNTLSNKNEDTDLFSFITVLEATSYENTLAISLFYKTCSQILINTLKVQRQPIENSRGNIETNFLFFLGNVWAFSIQLPPLFHHCIYVFSFRRWGWSQPCWR